MLIHGMQSVLEGRGFHPHFLMKLFSMVFLSCLLSLNMITLGLANSIKLTPSQIEQQVKSVPGWRVENESLIRTFVFRDFVGAIDFVNKLVIPAEKAGHHPDITISYNKVTIKLTTHDVQGLTEEDFDLARIINNFL